MLKIDIPNGPNVSSEITLADVLKSKKLPSLPTVAVEILELAKNSEAGIPEFVEVVRKDPALCTRIMGYVNSPLFGCTRTILDVNKAVSMLGRSRTVTQTLGFYLTDDVKAWPMKRHYELYWLRSAVIAVTAQILAEKKGLAKNIDFFLVGLLLDVGQLAMLRTIKDHYWQIYEMYVEEGSDLFELEKSALGFDHAQVGARVLEAWNLPNEITSLVANHHLSDSDESTEQVCLLAALCGDYFTLKRDETLEEIIRVGEKYFQIALPEVEELMCEIEAATREAAAAMSIRCNELPEATELMSDAMETVIELTDPSNIASQPLD